MLVRDVLNLEFLKEPPSTQTHETESNSDTGRITFLFLSLSFFFFFFFDWGYVWASKPQRHEQLVNLPCSAGLLAHHLLFLLNPQLIIKTWPAYIFSTGITLIDVFQNWLDWFCFLLLEGGLLVILIDCMIFFVTIPKGYKDVYLNSFFPGIARFSNSLHIREFYWFL